MCGIAGIFSNNGSPVEQRILAQMGSSLAHRGPDGQGSYVDDGSPGIGLVSRRLAIIDIPGGGQPMSCHDTAYTIVYNGEIYNAAELRVELESQGHRFRSRSDTEVVLRGYAEWGSEVLGRLNGMWAFAIWDRPARRLFLARDRLGVKPLVYARTPGGLVFGSEIKALLASGLVAPDLDVSALPHYLSSFVVPEPHSFIRGVRRLPSGHYVLADANGTREIRYWDCSFPEEADQGRARYREEVTELLADSVKRRLVSDVPLGVFLSAGIDSALVATVAARASSAPLKTFTLGFDGAVADERPAARDLARILGAEHHEDVMTAREAAAALPNLLAAHDEPSQSLIQNFFVARMARRDVTVALSGIGGDELFSSYPTHRVVDHLARVDRLPGGLRGLLLGVAPFLGARGRNLHAIARMQPDERLARRLLHQTDARTRENLLAPNVRSEVNLEAPVQHLESHLSRSQARHPLNRALYVYLKTYLPDELLRTLDTMSMYHSLEARAPLLDYRLVERVMRMPARHKSNLSAGKVLLRDIARGSLPAGWARRSKRGFSLPLDIWLHGELTETLRDILSVAATARRGLFDPPQVAAILKRCLSGDERLIPPVMMLFAFEQWARRTLDAKQEHAPSVTSWEVSAPSGQPPELSVIIVNWNTTDILRNCLVSVERHLAPVQHEVLVVDNASSDGSPDMVAKEFPDVRLLRNATNVGFARANNQAMRVARGQRFLLLNSDTLLTDDSVVRLLDRVRCEPAVGVAHCQLLLPDGHVQHSTYRFPRLDLALLEDLGLYKLLPKSLRGRLLLAGYWDHAEERDVDWVAGAFMLMPRAVFEDTGGFSEEYFMYGEDMEWGYRIRDAGWRIRFYPQARITHLDHASAAQRWGDERVAICIKRQLDIYRMREGSAKGIAFHAVRLTGAVIRAAYFVAASVVKGRRDPYFEDMRRYHSLSLRVHAALAIQRR